MAANTGTYLIQGAAILGGDPTDLLVRDGIIAEIGSGLTADGATVINAAGLVALPGMVDVHTHLREPGREDAETVETGTRAAALGGYTAVHAMANSTPVADTAGVVEQVYTLGRAAGWVDVRPVGAVTVGLAGEQLAELGAMADSRARVRIFSDDGICVHDPVLMRRALEYVKAFDGVVAQHAQEPRLTAGAQMNEGDVSAVLGLTGWPAVAEESIIARDVLLAQHVGSRLHVCHVSTAGSVEIIRWAKRTGHRRHGRGHPAPPPAYRRPGAQLRPRLQGQSAAAHRRRRPGIACRAGRRNDRRCGNRPRPAPQRAQGMRMGAGSHGHDRA
ncbi:dihydroorotase (multifunctional complex type) [Arthrobacter ulcerisalmonis]|nr:dihydroorotase (multifunctional complex type) [Arthrobacter ulcerisalmonis]